MGDSGPIHSFMRHMQATADEFFSSHANIQPNHFSTLPIESNPTESSSLERKSVAMESSLPGKTLIYANFEHVSFFPYAEHETLENLGTREGNNANTHSHKPWHLFQHSTFYTSR